MNKIKLTLPDNNVVTGKQISFIAPCDASETTCLVIDGTDYIICNAVGTDVAGTNAWVSGAIISVILNVEDAKAYIQNAAVSGGGGEAVPTYDDTVIIE